MAVSGSLFVSRCNNHSSFGLCKISTSQGFFQDGVIEHFIMRRSIKLKNLLLTYCKTVGIKYEETRFFVDGFFFNHERTPNELGMQDYELIAAMAEQLGGGAGAGAA